MPLNLKERQVHAAARRIGLKLIADSYKADQTDARDVVCEPPSGGYEMAMSTRGRRPVTTPLSLDDIELLIGGWSEPAGAIGIMVDE